MTDDPIAFTDNDKLRLNKIFRKVPNKMNEILGMCR